MAYEENTESGIYAIQFAFQFEENKDAPSWVEMQVRVTDCASNTRYVSIQLNYNQTTGMYTGALKLNQNKECPWGFSYAEITAYNRCKEKTSWSVEPVRKGNSLGTKNSSTKASAKPQLL